MARRSGPTSAPRDLATRSQGEGETPVRQALKPESPLRGLVCDGLKAMEADHSKRVEEKIRGEFPDSLNLDAALEASHPNDHRWDYLVGHMPSGSASRVVGIEVHSAHTREVSVVIAKKEAARDQLREHLRNGQQVAAWLWVASGPVAIPQLDKHRQLLAQSGVRLVGKIVLAKNLA